MKYGIFGGTFDPFHNEHLKIIENAIIDLKLDKLIIVPSYNPPHKKIATDFKKRVDIINLYIGKNPKVIVEEIENELKLSESYTYLILEKLINKYGNNVCFIMGGDSLVDFKDWMHPDVIAKRTPIIVYPRGDTQNMLDAKRFAEKDFNATIQLLSLPLCNLSSTFVRLLFEIGSTKAAKYISREAYNYIVNNNIYGEHKMLKVLKMEVNNKTFMHSLNTAECALELAWRNPNINLNDVLIAALLHDCAKKDIILKPRYNGVSEAVVHQYTSADKAAVFFGVSKPLVLDAIRYHTTGKPYMTTLGKIVYIADKIEASRTYEGVEGLRAYAEHDIDNAFFKILEHSFEHATKKAERVDILTEITLLWYNAT